MAQSSSQCDSPLNLRNTLVSWLRSVAPIPAVATKPEHFRPWHWPLHPVSLDYHVPASEWHGRGVVRVMGEEFHVEIARTPFGVFGRCPQVDAEAKGDDEPKMMRALEATIKPLLKRQSEIAAILGNSDRFTGSIRELDPNSKLRLFFAEDRSISHEAQTEVETDGKLSIYAPSLIAILEERYHPHRRTAQWLVLDLFEDLQSFCPDEASQKQAIDAIEQLMWDADDDFARTIYKAGVVLGGHVLTEDSSHAILRLVNAPSRIARRSAMHASFHLCEWMPSKRADVLEALRRTDSHDEEPMLRTYATGLIRDIEAESIDHVAEPIFPDEP